VSISEQALAQDSLTTAEQDQKLFDDNGYIGPLTILETSEVDSMWKDVRVQLLDKKNAIYGNNKMNYDRHLDVKGLSDIVSHPPSSEGCKTFCAARISFAGGQSGSRSIPAVKPLHGIRQRALWPLRETQSLCQRRTMKVHGK